MKTIAICASVSFYPQAVEIKQMLVKQGWQVLLPDLANELERTGDISLLKNKDETLANPQHKATLIVAHFTKISQSDAILVINEEKHGRAGYIGANVLMEMAVAFYLQKPIFLWRAFDPESPFIDEIQGMLPVVVSAEPALIK